MPELVRVTRGVWRPPDAVADLAARCAALRSVLPPDAVVSGLTAARLHGLWLPKPGPDERPEFIVQGTSELPRNHARTGRREMRVRRRRLHPDDIDQVDGLPVTAPSTTWLHLSESLVLPDLVAAGDCVLRAGAHLDELVGRVHRSRRQRGVLRARAALPLLDARSRSRPESWLRVGLVTRGHRPSGVNVAVRDEYGQWLAEPDISFDDARLALEYNGHFHADLGRMRRDMTRGVDLAGRGRWYTVALGPVEVFQRMDLVAALVGDLRAERASLFRRAAAGPSSVGLPRRVATYKPTLDA